MAPPRQIRAEDCFFLASSLAGALARLGININKTSDLARMQEALEWLGSFPSDAPQPDTAYKKDPERAVRAFALFEQASRLAAAITLAENIPGSAAIVRKLGKRLDRTRTQDEPAQDFFFELDVAQRMWKNGLRVAFDEPDIVLLLEEINVGLACKRPRTIDRVRQRIEEASRQIVRSNLPGFIVIGVEAIFHKSGDSKKPVVIYEVEQPSELELCAAPIMIDIVQAARPAIGRAFDKGIWGILFCGIITGFSREPSANVYRWIRRAISSPSGLPGLPRFWIYRSSARLRS